MEKKFKHLTYESRIKIERYARQGLKPARIAAKLGFDRTTIARELALGTVTLWPVGSDPFKSLSKISLHL